VGGLYIRIARPPDSIMSNYSPAVQEFYLGMAERTRAILIAPEVMKFVYYIARREGLDESKITDVRVMVFPSLFRNRVMGMFHKEKRQISIFPQLPFKVPKKSKRLKFTLDDIANDTKISKEISSETIKVLMHEVLHLKYYSERLVRAKTDLYFKEFENKKIGES
jgi:hypothetical protein